MPTISWSGSAFTESPFFEHDCFEGVIHGNRFTKGTKFTDGRIVLVGASRRRRRAKSLVLVVVEIVR